MLSNEDHPFTLSEADASSVEGNFVEDKGDESKFKVV